MLSVEEVKAIWPEFFEVLERAERGAAEYAMSIQKKYGIGNEDNDDKSK